MIDTIVKGAIAIGAIVLVAYLVSRLWSKLQKWASEYLAKHPKVRKVYVSATEVAARIKRAQNKMCEKFTLPIFGCDKESTVNKKIYEEDVPIDQADEILKKANANPILALRS